MVQRRMFGLGIGLFYILLTAMIAYELVAKSPQLMGDPLPGWDRADRAEHRVRWRQPTGWIVLDKALHESQEAALYYGMLLEPAHLRQPASPPES